MAVTAEKIADIRDLSREEWLRERQKGIGGSDIPAILGISPWASPLSVYMEKTTDIKEEASDLDNLQMEVGKELEGFLAKKFEAWLEREEGHKVEVVQEPHILQHPGYTWAMGNLDGVFEHPEKGLCGLELKTTNEFMRGEWEGDELPDTYYFQVQWYMFVTGLDTFYIAYLIGNRKFNAKEVPRNQEVIDVLYQKAEEFWNDHVLAQEPPAPIGTDADTEALKYLYPEEEKGEVVDLSDMQGLRDEYKEIMKEKKELDSKINEIKQRFMARMGEAETAYVGGKKVAWKTINRKGYTVEPKTYREMRIY